MKDADLYCPLGAVFVFVFLGIATGDVMQYVCAGVLLGLISTVRR